MSSKRALRRKQCERKTRFETKDEALASARHTRAVSGRGPVAAYRCRFCGGWHVGHLNKNQIRAMAQRRAD